MAGKALASPPLLPPFFFLVSGFFSDILRAERKEEGAFHMGLCWLNSALRWRLELSFLRKEQLT